ncbi:MAG: cobalamin-dependent protein, partial [Candidatus Margulisiibacteriota bacterium]
MRMLFIEFNIDSTIGINQGLITLSSVLKANDVDVDLLLISDSVDTPFNLDHIKEYILKTKPDIIGLSLIETQLQFVKLFCEDAKNYFNGKIICGGPCA